MNDRRAPTTKHTHAESIPPCPACLPTVEELAAALHEDCIARWQRKAEADPLWQGTQHMADAHIEEAESALAALRAARQSGDGR